jgi:hypothetical protein
MHFSKIALIGSLPVVGLTLTMAACSASDPTMLRNESDSDELAVSDELRKPRGCKGNPRECDAGTDAETGADSATDSSAPAPATCTSFTYSAYGACQPDSTQTRTVLASSPAGCMGGAPVLSQACVYVPPTVMCTSFTYSAFGACQTTNTQSRTVVSSSPAGCTGGAPVLTQACVYVPPPISFANAVQPIFTNSCAGCHDGAVPPNLSEGVAYGALVNVNGRFCTTAKYVVPSQPNQSWLVSKITAGSSIGTCSGGSMANYVSAAERNTIMTWVQQGAPNN